MPKLLPNHRKFKRLLLLSLSSIFLLSQVSWATEANHPALQSRLATKALLVDIQPLNQGLIAAGEQGIIIYKASANEDWQQAEVPVNTFITSLAFTSSTQGFAVGHQGTILTTNNSGKNWQLVEEDPASPPLLSLAFVDNQLGFAVGAYGLALITQDGGNSWEDITDNLPNEEGMHLNSLLIDTNQNIYIAGEEGSLFVSNDLGANWQFYDLSGQFNSIFNLSQGADQAIYLTGLRGSLGVSYNQGESWQSLTGVGQTSLSYSLPLANQDLLLVGENGSYFFGSHHQLTTKRLTSRASLMAAAELNGKVYAVGKNGVHTLPLNNKQEASHD